MEKRKRLTREWTRRNAKGRVIGYLLRVIGGAEGRRSESRRSQVDEEEAFSLIHNLRSLHLCVPSRPWRLGGKIFFPKEDVGKMPTAP